MNRRVSGLSFYHKKKKINTSLLKEIAIWAGEILLTIIGTVILVSFFGFKISVVGPSMSPTLENGDQILVNRFLYKLFEPGRNDLVVFSPNGNQKSHYYVKRIIGLPGDVIEIKDGIVYVNREPFPEKLEVEPVENALMAEQEIIVGEEEYVEDLEPAYIDDAGIAKEAITLGEDEYFVLGDNRNNSEDSRYASIGNVKKDHITGKAWLRVYPWEEIGLLK